MDNLALRSALVRRDFTTAIELLDGYSAEVTRRWHALETEEERKQMAGDVLAFMNWAQKFVLVVRAQLHEQSKQLTAPRAYMPPPGTGGRLYQMEG